MKKWVGFLGLLVFLSACEQKKEVKRMRLPSGLEYEHFINNEDRYRAQLNDYLQLEVRILSQSRKDTISDTFLAEGPLYRPAEYPKYAGAPEEALVMLHEGDSIHLYVEANKKYQYEQRPRGVVTGDRIEYQIKVQKVYKPDEYTALRTRLEEVALQKYLKEAKERGENYKKHPSGIYYRQEAGVANRDELPYFQPGDRISMHFTGRFLNGLSFDRTDNPKEPEKSKPIEFTLGKVQIIPAWDITFREIMKPGDQLTILVPFKYSFGTKGNPKLKVPPYATTTFKIRAQKLEE
ncbi:MAG: FKBP-type peptidyl-prolyl cis-trans isomerase [Bacteroidota bacterium]